MSKRFVLPPTLCLSLLFTSCQKEEAVKKPTGPDLSEVVAAYDAPTAELTPESAANALDSVNALVAQLQELGLQDQLLSTINTTIDQQQAQSSGEGATTQGVEDGAALGKLQQRVLKGDAYLVATRICGGYSDEPVPDRGANGAITLTLGVSGDSLDPVMWGSFEDCKYRLAGNDIRLSGEGDEYGSYAVWVGEDVGLGDFKLSTVLFQLSVWTELNEKGQLLELDFWLDLSTTELKFRIPVEGGYVIARASTTLVGVEATNGTFGCNAEERYCEAGDERIDF